MNLTKEQSSILSLAIERPGMAIITASDSPNDHLWRALVDRGMLEAITEITEPHLRGLVELCDLRVYRVRPHVAQRAADFTKASQHVGTA
jgi:hypothetical protein